MAKSGLLKSKGLAWLAFIIMLIVLVVTFKMRAVWWNYFDIFFAFMMVFTHLMATVVNKFNSRASRQLDMIALVAGVLTVLSIIGEYIAWQVIAG